MSKIEPVARNAPAETINAFKDASLRLAMRLSRVAPDRLRERLHDLFSRTLS